MLYLLVSETSHRCTVVVLTSGKHSNRGQSSMLGLKPLQQRRQRQEIEQRVEESKMYEWKCIQSVH